MDTDQIAGEIKTAIANLPTADTASLRTVRKTFSKQIRDANPREVIDLARALIRRYKVPNFIGYELIERHQRTLRSLTDSDLADLALDLNSWWTVDAFACCLAGV